MLGLDGLGRWTAFCCRALRPTAYRLMRNGPHKPTRRPLPKPAPEDANRAGIRALDCGEELEAPVVIRRAEPPAEPKVTESPPTLGEQRPSV